VVWVSMVSSVLYGSGRRLALRCADQVPAELAPDLFDVRLGGPSAVLLRLRLRLRVHRVLLVLAGHHRLLQ
jgi:hypothetical protein